MLYMAKRLIYKKKIKKAEVFIMKTSSNVTVNTGKDNNVAKVGSFLNRNSVAITCMLLMSIMVMSVASASSADTLWNTVSGLIQTWVTRLGGVVMFVGGVMFGLGWKSDDAEQKSRGISTLIAGAIVVAVAALTTTFFA